MVEKNFIIGSSISIIIGIILLFIAYNFYNKNYIQEPNKDTVQNQAEKLNIEKMHKFLGKIFGFIGIICIGFPLFIYYMDTHPTTTTTTKPNTRTSYSNATTNALFKFFG